MGVSAPELLKNFLYKQRNCDHKILMPDGLKEWKLIDCVEVFSICPHCDKKLNTPKET